MIEYLRRGVHLPQDCQHLLVDERLVLPQVHVEVLLQPAPDVLAGDLVQVDGHHDLLERGADDPFGLVALPRLRAHGVGRWGPLRLQVVHGVPLVEAGPVRLDPVLIVADPAVAAAALEVVLRTRLRADLVQGLQRGPAIIRKNYYNNGVLKVYYYYQCSH